ncbi:MAG: HIT family protein [Nanoarchaeota archaeon]|jgi:histidine triad (HIT) family protein|nr:HIT family protein [Nanoarchaeota archaeon]|tara:strand:+ start:17484 stop:17888 length:405 start_codon:yes stop_codon:yes gene_type:complete
MADCIFCKIIKGDIPYTKIYEDKDTLAFLDNSPASLGHTLVIPKKHSETLDQMEEKDLKSLILTAQKIAKAISQISKGYNLIQNNGKVAGQIVSHVHFHLIPRNKKTELNWTPSQKFSEKEIKEVTNKIKTLLK